MRARSIASKDDSAIRPQPGELQDQKLVRVLTELMKEVLTYGQMMGSEHQFAAFRRKVMDSFHEARRRIQGLER